MTILIAEALAALGELDAHPAAVDPEVIQARRKLAEARALLRGG